MDNSGKLSLFSSSRLRSVGLTDVSLNDYSFNLQMDILNGQLPSTDSYRLQCTFEPDGTEVWQTLCSCRRVVKLPTMLQCTFEPDGTDVWQTLCSCRRVVKLPTRNQ